MKKAVQRDVRDNKRGRATAYEGAMEAIIAIPVAIGFGYWGDRTFDSQPVGLIIGAVVGFAAFVWRLTKMRKLIEETAVEEQQRPGRKRQEQSGEEQRHENSARGPNQIDD